MDVTTKDKKVRNARKMLLWFGMISIVMTFAGLTSAYVVSSTSRPDWLFNLILPKAFFYSTGTIILSSVLFFFAIRKIKKGVSKQASWFLWGVLILGVTFITLQFDGFYEFIKEGYYFTGSESNITVSYIYIIAFLHIMHVVAGLIVLSVVIFNNYRGKYTEKNYLGAELGATFWHFLDLLWIYLILFFYFYR